MDKLLGMLGNFNSKKLGIAAGAIAAIVAIPAPEAYGALVKIGVIGLIVISHMWIQSGVDKKRVEKEVK